MGVFGILLSLGLLMYLAYRGITVLVLAPLLALLAVLMSGGASLLPTYTEVFMVNLANYLRQYFPLFLLGAIFGKLMDETGAAKAIAHAIVQKLGKERAILAIVLSCGILTYGGVSLFVVAFAVYPLAAALFRETGTPKRLIPACIALGSFTFTMTALPGTPQIQNAIPIPFFKTDAYAAPILGLIAGIMMFTLGTLWIQRRAKKMIAAGEGYLPDHMTDETAATVEADVEVKMPSLGISLAPIGIVLVLNFWLSKMYFPGQIEALTPILEKFNTTPGKVIGIWSIIVSLVISILFILLTNYKRINVMEAVNKGAYGSMLAILNTASEVGYGNVIAGLTAFAAVKAALLGVAPGNPLISEAISVNVLAGITGSASGGMSIALGALGETYYNLALEKGINPQVLHRIAALSCGGLDSLPHNGAVITLLGICGLNHKLSYADVGMVSVVIPLATTIVAIILGTIGIV